MVQKGTRPFVTRSEDDFIHTFEDSAILQVDLAAFDTIVEIGELSERLNFWYELGARWKTPERPPLEWMKFVPFVCLWEMKS